MNAHTIPLWAQVLGGLYIATGVFRFFCHVPQVRRCMDSSSRADGVSLATWFGLLICSLVAFLYAAFVVGDVPLLISTGANVLGPLLVILAILKARISRRHESDLEEDHAQESRTN
jgi:hypothetical protein